MTKKAYALIIILILLFPVMFFVGRKTANESSAIPVNTERDFEDFSLCCVPTNDLFPLNLDEDTKDFLLGAWKVDKLLGFGIIYNDQSEYPLGQKIIGDTIVIKENLFSTKNLIGYEVYQFEIRNPAIYVDTNYDDAQVFLTQNRVNNKDGKFEFSPSDKVKSITITNENKDMYPISFFVVNDERLILRLEATYFELVKEK